jgi:DNA (cytosine-5)-methyltransferase 1
MSSSQSEGDGEYLLVVVDLFCGAGGFSTGLIYALFEKYSAEISAAVGKPTEDLSITDDAVQAWFGENIKLAAVNHWDRAVETYEANHPWVDVYNAKVQALHPPDVVDGHSVDLLLAGPSCIPWSRAKGGMADDDQQRMSPRHCAHYLELLRPTTFCLENVPGLLKWGPLRENEDGTKEMVKDGSLFDDWIDTLERLGYAVNYDTLVAADYGDPQSRRRLFVMGRLNYTPTFPDPTHSSNPDDDLKPHRTAAEIIDWSDVGESLWMKSRPLVKSTNQRIAAGIREYGDDRLAPFADAISDLAKADVEAMQDDPVPVSDAAEAAQEREQPFLVEGPVFLDDALETAQSDEQTARSLCVPQVMAGGGGGTARPVDSEPVPTATASGAIHYIDPEVFVLPRNGLCRDEFSNPAYDPSDRPAHTFTAKNNDGRVVESCLVPLYSERPDQDPRTRSVDRPLMTVPASKGPAGLSRPFLVKYYGNSDTASVDEPIPTVTGTETMALCVPECYPWGLDVRYRMLKPREAARAQGFPEDYDLSASTIRDKRQLIGNAVPVNLAKALCRTLLEPTDSPTLHKFGTTPSPAADALSDD